MQNTFPTSFTCGLDLWQLYIVLSWSYLSVVSLDVIIGDKGAVSSVRSLWEGNISINLVIIGSFLINLIFPRFKLVMLFLRQLLVFTVNNSFYFCSLRKKLQFSVNWFDKFYRFGANVLNLGNFSLHIVLTTKVLVYCGTF